MLEVRDQFHMALEYISTAVLLHSGQDFVQLVQVAGDAGEIVVHSYYWDFLGCYAKKRRRTLFL